ncbi:MAG: folate-binding protein [Burkholderiaceae bacterium]
MDFLVHLNDLTVLRIEGEDASSFLHTQLSNDISGLGADNACLAAYCTPKGRMLGSLVVWPETAETGSPLIALVKTDLLEPLLQRLRMFVLRAKVSFEITNLKAYGVSMALQAADSAHTAWPAPAGPWMVHRDAQATRISAPTAAAGPRRWWLVCPEGSKALDQVGVPLQQNGAVWYAQDIEAGLGWVEQANVEFFIPQSLNYDLIGGVSFTKGCYPGQEVVARAHFRGAVKRRAIPAFCQAEDGATLQAGMDIFDAQRPKSPAGRIINAAAAVAGSGQAGRGWHLLMEINLTDIGHADFRALSPEGPVIRLLPLPYPLEEPR